MAASNPTPDPKDKKHKAAQSYGCLIALVLALGFLFWATCGGGSKGAKPSGSMPVQRGV